MLDMFDCDRCGTAVWWMEPRQLLALVPPENRYEVRQIIRDYGGNDDCMAFVCPNCKWCGLSNDFD